MEAREDQLLGPVQVRQLAERYGIRPTKTKGQNFVIDPNTIRRIVRAADLAPHDIVLEVGPGLGSLTLGLLDAATRVIAVEIDAELAARLPATVAEFRGEPARQRLDVLPADALRINGPEDLVTADGDLLGLPTVLVANLPYNVAVPVLLQMLQVLPTIRHGLVMVQAEVAERLAASAGDTAYGVPSAKAAWYAHVQRAGSVSRNVFWPIPHVDSGLVSFTRRPVPDASREVTFACIDAAFSQRRKMLRTSLATWAGGSAVAENYLQQAGISVSARAQELDVADFAAIARAAQRARTQASDVVEVA